MRNSLSPLAWFQLICVLLGLMLLNSPVTADSGHKEVNEKDIHFFPTTEISLGDFPAEGPILDIGGGGEGIIGRLKGSQVVAIDINERELAEAPDGPLKIVMDASELKFLDNSFNCVTIFFTMMYIPAELHGKVLGQCARVLKPGGRLMIWDMNLTAQPSGAKKIAAIRLKIQLPGKTVKPGYGTHWPAKALDAAHYKQLADSCGLQVSAETDNGSTFYLELKKP
jgi:ubiquinone/menaquinone biosynthesis C-methylase UbiE